MHAVRRILPLISLAILATTARTVIAQPQGAQKSPAPLYVATFVDLMPSNKEAGTKAIRDYVVATKQEPGVIRIEAIAQVGGRDNHLVIFEVWKDQAAFDQHEASAATRDFRAKLTPLIGAPFDQRLHFLVQ